MLVGGRRSLRGDAVENLTYHELLSFASDARLVLPDELRVTLQLVLIGGSRVVDDACVAIATFVGILVVLSDLQKIADGRDLVADEVVDGVVIVSG